MNIYGISDLHGQLPEPPEDADLILIAGDVCPDFISQRYSGRVRLVKGEQRQAHWYNGEFRRWCDEAGAQVVGTWGNHDFLGEKPFLVAADHPCTMLIDRELEVCGLRVYGTPWVPRLPFWAFYGDDGQLRRRAEAVPPGLDVLLTHGPPAYCGDRIPAGSKYGNAHEDIYVGDPTLNFALREAAPGVTLCGHIHEGFGYHDFEGHTVINVAAVDEYYEMREHPWTKLHVD